MMTRSEPEPLPPEPAFLPAGWWKLLLHAARSAHDYRKLAVASAVLLGLLLVGFRLESLASDPARSVPPLPDALRSGPVAVLSQAARQLADIWLLPATTLHRLATRPASPAAWLLALAGCMAAYVLVLLAGAVITRLCAYDLARVRSPRLVPVLQTLHAQLFALFATPLAPVIGLSILALPCALVGLLFRLPGGAGTVLGGLFSIIPIVLAIPMGLLALGLILGWPLMVAGCATDSEDLLASFSGTYRYVFRRLIQLLVLVAVAWAVGTMGWLVVSALARLVGWLARFGLSLGAPANRLGALLFPAEGADGGQTAQAPPVLGLWLSGVRLVAYSWCLSYFWCAVTAIYWILRRHADGVPFGLLDVGREARIDTASTGETVNAGGPALPTPPLASDAVATKESPAIGPSEAVPAAPIQLSDK